MPQDEVYAVISAGRQRLRLPVGEAVTAGRSAANDLRIGHAPVDLRVPRQAVRLECRSNGVLIFNASDKRTITAKVFPGPDFKVAPLTFAGTASHTTVTLVIHGTESKEHTITIDSSRLVGAAVDEYVDQDDDANQKTIGYEPLPWVTERQRQMLCALVLPGRFGWRGQTTTPTYAQMAEILAERGIRIGAKYVRNTLDEMRLRTALDHDVYDIHSEGPSSGPIPPASYLPNFAQWIVLSGTVTDEDLHGFDDLAG